MDFSIIINTFVSKQYSEDAYDIWKIVQDVPKSFE